MTQFYVVEVAGMWAVKVPIQLQLRRYSLFQVSLFRVYEFGKIDEKLPVTYWVIGYVEYLNVFMINTGAFRLCCIFT